MKTRLILKGKKPTQPPKKPTHHATKRSATARPRSTCPLAAHARWRSTRPATFSPPLLLLPLSHPKPRPLLAFQRGCLNRCLAELGGSLRSLSAFSPAGRAPFPWLGGLPLGHDSRRGGEPNPGGAAGGDPVRRGAGQPSRRLRGPGPRRARGVSFTSPSSAAFEERRRLRSARAWPGERESASASARRAAPLLGPSLAQTAPMAIPPAYADLGKSARDIFNKGFGFGLVKLDVKTKSTSGVEFATSGSSNTDTGKVNGSLETKYKWAEYGVTFTEKWNTDNTLGTEMAIEDQIAKGLKLTFDTTFSPNTGKKSGKIKSAYKRECINLGCDVDFDFAGPAIHGSVVLGYEGWLAGYQMTFDSAKSKLTRNNFSVGYKTGDFQLHTNVNDGSEFGGSIFQKVSENLETAINLNWVSGTNSTRFGIAAKYQLDPTASISTKVNNSSLIGIGYTQSLRPGVKLTLSALVDGKNINAGGHKLGLGLELEA